jgi:hypothetical protein
MNHTFAKEAPALIIDIGIGVVGFVLSILWGKVTKTGMTKGTIRLLAGVWTAIAIFGMILAFVM